MFKDAIDQMKDDEYIEKLHRKVEKLEQQNKRYREALKKIKKEKTVTTGLSEGQVAYTFSGHIARKALEGDE